MEKLQCTVGTSDFIQECVDFPRFDLCCKACPNYSKNWSCPPLPVDPMKLWASYDRILLQCRCIDVPKNLREQTFSPQKIGEVTMQLLRDEKRAMLLELLELETQFPGSMALAAGSCDLCPEGNCSRAQNLPCRQPEHMRYSLETLGGDMSKALSLYFGRKLLWAENGKLPEYYVLLGALLIPNQ